MTYNKILSINPSLYAFAVSFVLNLIQTVLICTRSLNGEKRESVVIFSLFFTEPTQ